MRPVLLTRASTLAEITGFLQELGFPVGRDLSKFNLPMDPNLPSSCFVPVLQCIRFVAHAERTEYIDDIIYRSFSPRREPDLATAPFSSGLKATTLLEVLQNFARFVRWQNPGIKISISKDRHQASVVVSIDEMLRPRGSHHTDWTIVLQLASIIRACLRSLDGINAIRVRQPFTPCKDAFEQFSRCELQPGSDRTEIVFPVELLSVKPAQFQSGAALGAPGGNEAHATLDFPSSLEMLLRSYVREGKVNISFAAELTGASVRTLQRRLHNCGLHYSQIVQHARVTVATENLCDPEARVMDVALAAGYNDPSHFARAFRKITGVSPREYRRANYDM